MLDKSTLGRQLAQKTGLAIMAGSLTWVALLIYGAQTLKNMPMETTYDIAFGSLLLNTMAKQPAEEGFTVTFTFESGLMWYFLVWALLGVLAGLIFTMNTKPKR